NNEDAFAVRADLGLCVVADGMGGAAAGELASRIFTEAALEVFSNAHGEPGEQRVALVQKAFVTANERILAHVSRHPAHKGMGCTAEIVSFSADGFVLGHMGDSRTYRLRNSDLKQLSSDHSLVQEQVDQGVITPDEAKTHPMRNIILRAVGVKESVALDLLRGRIFRGDQFLLCSDGLTDMVGDATIKQVLSSGEMPAKKVETLIALANQAGGKDNITVVIAQVN
ncbi:MAG: serine/threonine-protein phosphatase, partial [Deltaproteobacteria bacterium]|nr:serine/threonine-protein phosphatase [Deltaproteobacteria bacterium]